MNAKRLFLIIFFVYLLGFFAHAVYLGKTVYGDGAYYFSWLQSAVVEQRLPPAPNKYTIGPALLWSVPYVWTHTIIRGTGNEFPYQLVVGTTSVLYTLFGLVLLRILTNNATVLAIAFATNLLFYGSLDPVNSHGLSFFASSLFLTFLFRRNALLAGLSLGLLGTIRPQDLVLGVAAFGMLRKEEWGAFFTGTLLGFLPQLAVWQVQYGSIFLVPYLTREGFNFLQPHIFEVLFSPQNGLLLYSPILALGFWGFKRSFSLAILLELLIVSSWSTWWQGASYGGRMFVSSLPLFAFGIASFFQWFIKRGWNEKMFLLTLVGPLCGLNALLVFFFLLSS